MVLESAAWVPRTVRAVARREEVRILVGLGVSGVGFCFVCCFHTEVGGLFWFCSKRGLLSGRKRTRSALSVELDRNQMHYY